MEVGRMMQKMAKDRGWPEDKCQEMFILGFLHDIGYEFTDSTERINQSKVGGNLLKNLRYPYWQEVYYHGHLDTEGFRSQYLDILNIANIEIGEDGSHSGSEYRLKQLAKTLGEDSEEYKNLVGLKEKLYTPELVEYLTPPYWLH